MLSPVQNALQLGDLRRKLLFTAGMLAVFRLGSYIPVPGVNPVRLVEALGMGAGSIFGFLDLFSGGALSRFTIFAMGVNPYITASIIMQLLQVVVPQLEEMSKEGIEGRKKIQEYTRYASVLLAVVQAIGVSVLAARADVLETQGIMPLVLIVVTLTAGSTFLMWLGEQITERGIGNGVSLLIFIGIVARLPVGAVQTLQATGRGGISPISLIVFCVLALLVIGGVIMVQEGTRRIPVQYAKRMVGRRMYGGQTTHVPLRLNSAGVMPVIFASSVLTFPLTIAQFIPGLSWIERAIGYGTVGYYIVYVVMVVFFTYFYTAVIFNPTDLADNMKKHGGFIPGLRPGRPTAEYLDRILTRITLAGALFLALIAVLPYLIAAVTRMPTQFLYFGGTGLLIVVGVALDTMKQIESHLLMRQYEGFMK